jgi:hypothetical protein
MSHIERLCIVPHEEVVNPLLQTIGSSLEHLGFHLPPILGEWLLILNCVPASDFTEEAEGNFAVNLEFNTVLKILLLMFPDMTQGIMTLTNFTWLLRFLSSINTSNRIEQIKVHLSIQGEIFEPGDCLVWMQFDRILADMHFEFLQKLEFSMAMYPDDDEDSDSLDSPELSSVCTSIVAAFLLEPVHAGSPSPKWTEARIVGLRLQLMCCAHSVIQPWISRMDISRRPKLRNANEESWGYSSW